MRATRYLWISNLPAHTTEQDIRDVLLSHGKIQSVRIHSDGLTYSAVVAFVDTQSATRAVQSTIRINKVNLSLQYCESSGIPGVANQDMLGNSADSMKTNSSGFSQHGEVHPSRENRSTSAFSEFSNSSHDSEEKRKATSWYNPVLECSLFCFSSSHRSDNRLMTSDLESNSPALSGRFTNEQRGLLVRHLPLRSSDTNLREGLFHEYKKHGKITSVVVRGQAEERYCLITFKRSEDAARALELSRGKLFFGIAISVSLHNGIESEDPDLCPPEHALDEYHPKATKTLFVGNLCSNTITQEELRKIFRPYGEIIELDIKVQANQPGTSYAFVQYTDIRSVVRALSNQDAIRVGDKPVKLGFGKSQPTNVVWLDNLPTVTEAFLTRQFGRYGHLTHVVLDRKSSRALLYFDTVEMAQRALNETRNRAFLGRKVQLDYAGYECQVAFMRRLSKNDSFGQAYDDYRSFGEAPKDNHSIQSDEFDTSPYDRRSSSKHLPSADRTAEPTATRTKSGLLESSRGKTHSSRIATTSGSTPTSSRHRTLDRDFGLHVSFSSASDSRSGSNLPKKRHGHPSSFRPCDSDLRIVGDTARCEASSRKCLLPSKTSPFLETKRHQHRLKDGKSTPIHSAHRVSSTRGATRSNSHYLGETDDVSSGSLSPVVDALETLPEVPSLKREFQPTQNLPRFGAVSKNVVTDENLTPSRQSTSSNRQQRYNSMTRENSIPESYKYHDSVSPRVIHSRVHRRYHNSSEESSPLRTGFLDTGKSNRHGDREQFEYNTCRPRFQAHRQNFSVRSVDSHRSSDNDRPSDFVNYSTSNLPFHSADHLGTLMIHSPTAKSEDRKPKPLSGEIRCQQAPSSLGFSQLSDTSGESNDTLTKLELERAKLLRELSLLNNEVVGSKSKSSLNVTRKRGSHDSSVDDLRLSKSRRASYSKSVELGDSSGFGLSSESNLPSLPSNPGATDCHAPNGTTEPQSSDTCKPLLTSSAVSVLSRQFNGCFSSSSEPGELFSPVTTEHMSPGIPVCLAFQTTDTCPSSYAKPGTSPKVLMLGASDAFPCRSTLIHSSPQILMPPEPTSPLTRLSPPDSPISTDKFSGEQEAALPELPRPHLSQSDASGKGSTVPAASAGPVSINRDPRLTAHVNQTSIDIPPPPPPPESLKLPLWVDTSVRSELHSSKMSTLKTQSSVVNKPDQRRPSVNDCELEASYHEASSSSLDERIRLLDAQLMKSEKARPTVDYSKFRIRRKIEPSCTTPNVDSLITTSVSSIAPTSTITEPCFSPAAGLASCGRHRNERGSLSDVMACSLPGLSSVTSSTSPNPSVATSPLSLTRPADTSEFVKSMLSSSRPSPTAPVVDLAAVSTAVESVMCSRSLYLRTIPTISSSPCNRTVADTGEKYMSALSTTQTVMSNNSIKSFGNISCHYLLPTCVVSHSSLNGTQPVGVATRLPSVSHTIDSSLCSDDGNAHLESGGSDQPAKSILRRDMLSPDQFGRVEPDSVMTSDIHLKKSVTGSFQPSINKKLLSQTQGARTDKFIHPSIKTSISQPSKINTETVEACARSSQHKSAYSRPGSPIDAVSKGKLAPPKKANVLSQRCDIPRPTLDDSLFKTTFSGALAKEDGKPKRPRIVPSDLSKKKKKVMSAPTADTAPRSNDGPKVAENVEGEAAVARGFVQSFEKSVSEIRKKESDKRDSATVQEGRPQMAKGELLSSGDVCKQSVSALSCVSDIKVKRKSREIRRRIINSDSSDAEISERARRKHSGVSETTPMETGYESMYDKIKRRASKSTGAVGSLAEKTHIFQQCQKAQQKSVQKRSASTKNSRCSQSSVGDSDTDECLSDLSESCENAETTRYQSKRNSLGVKPEQLPRKKPKSGDRRLKVNSAMRSKKRPPSYEPADTLQSRSTKKGGKTSARNQSIMNNMDHSSASMKSNGTNVSVSNRGKRRAKGIVNTKQDADSSETSIKRKRGRQLLCRPSNDTDCTPSKKTFVSSKTSAAVLSAEQRRILVRRVFASTDSDTPSSLSSSEPETECIDKSTDLSVGGSGSHPDKSSARRAFTSSTSHSPSPLVSRSCSPDDLGADAAERHTFGAFSLPSGVVDLKDKVSLSPKSISPSDKSSFTKSSADLHANTSKLTPPTIPMVDSSSSTDQFYSNADKLRGRDSGDWNIFTSLTKQSTPKQDLSDTACSSKLASDFLTDNSRSKVLSKSHCDFDDELPSLEKHDDEYPGKLNSDSELLLHESNGATQRGECLSLNDDDLPPPVVSALEDFCPTGFGNQYDAATVAQNCVSQQSDVIEEVIYDSLELHLPCSEQAQTASKSPLSLTVKLDCPEDELPKSTDASALTDNKLEPDSPTLANQSAKCNSTDISGGGSRLTIVTVSPTSSGTSISTPTSTSTMSSLTLQPPLFAPLTMLTTTSQSGDLAAVGQPVLVTVPRSAAGVSFASSSLTFVPASIQPPSATQSSNPANQRHVTLLLPASSMPLNTPSLSLQNPPVTAVYTKSAVVYNNISTSSNNPSSVCIVPTSNTMTGLCLRRGESDPVQTTDGICISSSRKLPISTTLISSTPATISGFCDSHISANPSPVNHNTCFNRSDFTSYVQRVIERVKQEKDEEVMHQREKVRRPKKTSTTIVQVPSPSTVCLSSSIESTLASSVLPNTATSVTLLPAIAPMPALTTMNAYPKQCASASSLDSSLAPNSRLAFDSKFIIKPDPTDVPLTNKTEQKFHILSDKSVDNAIFGPSAPDNQGTEVSMNSKERALGSSAEASGAKFFQNFKSVDSTAVPTSNSQLGNIAAQLANDTLTNYFYSLLRQHQLRASSSPTTGSVESSSNQKTENVQSIRSPATLQTVFKGSSVSNSSTANDTADLLAAFATMAAMASPQHVGSHESTPLLCPVNNSVTHDLPANCETIASFDLQGLLSLKNEEVYVQMHFLGGNRDLLKDCMGVIAEQNVTSADPETSLSQPLKIVQRMRLEPSQLDGVQRKLRQVTDFCMCLTLATASPQTAEVSVLNEKVRMNHVLCDGFIKYLVDKCAAGIINVCHPCTQQNLYVIHIFPPCEFARSQLEGTAPILLRQLSQCSTPYLLVVVTTV
ncbi:uncharacterized protein DEA37_0005555 [Paragonimus westermani]|uniref:Msx2-interacting protein n=1 Tax=Paragonimus westermani TaxID=34504 RepID=A0A5J4NVC4_9TREM|nr:uncharacterized protein DEA37_0005555 [Paragonimus westermani]